MNFLFLKNIGPGATRCHFDPKTIVCKAFAGDLGGNLELASISEMSFYGTLNSKMHPKCKESMQN